MKPSSVLLLGCICALASFSTSYGFPQDVILNDEVRSYANTLFDELPEESYQAAVDNYRLKRATCDLLSGFGVNDSACAAHCVLRATSATTTNAATLHNRHMPLTTTQNLKNLLL
ncbi:defensin-B-like [Uranotaenia lowii]|uniref:defensin-B-like n=1 Tax=Uranotaenia lowii TaxID=190385 RepID=UPI00247846D8|nr:defensin-B-like [Uranotaenia lowii]